MRASRPAPEQFQPGKRDLAQEVPVAILLIGGGQQGQHALDAFDLLFVEVAEKAADEADADGKGGGDYGYQDRGEQRKKQLGPESELQASASSMECKNLYRAGS